MIGVPGVPETTAATVDDHAVLLDVREPREWQAGHVAGSTLVPMQALPGEVELVRELAGGAPVVVVCRSGNRSAHATAFLRQQGIDAANLVGGLQAWAAAGRPLVNDAGGVGVVV